MVIELGIGGNIEEVLLYLRVVIVVGYGSLSRRDSIDVLADAEVEGGGTISGEGSRM